MACSNCGDNAGPDRNRRGPNLLDCDTQSVGCHNPCHHGPENTPQSESLPSQIQNFSTQFFGDLIKTEVNGKIVWSLPCSLDVGLPANPRGATEPLACYFLRLFNDGVVGIPGVQGAPGTNGSPGSNAWTTTAQAFSQPSLSAPTVQIITNFTPAIVPGLGIFIEGSGWYHVDNTDQAGTLFLTLISPVSNPAAVVPAGTLVVPSGLSGVGLPGTNGANGVQGPQGAVGPQGPQGIPGIPGNPASGASLNNGQYIPPGGMVVFSTTSTAYVTVTNSGITPQITLPNVGTYLIFAIVPIAQTAATATTPFVSLVDTTAAATVTGSEAPVFIGSAGGYFNVTIGTLYQILTPNHVLEVQVKTPAGVQIQVPLSSLSGLIITWIQIA
jgi:hypothetical protein